VGKGSFGSVYLVSRRRDKAQFVLKNMQIKNVPDKELEVSNEHEHGEQRAWGELCAAGACDSLIALDLPSYSSFVRSSSRIKTKWRC
jgi:hypothetical protein